MQEQMKKFKKDIRQIKQVAHESNVKASEGLKVEELLTELKTLKKVHSNTQEELKIKEKNIASLKLELEKAKGFQLNLTEKDDSLRKLKEELSSAKENEANAMDLFSNFKKRVHELEAQVANRRLWESKILNSLASQTREFEQTKIELEQSKVDVSSLHKEIESLLDSFEQNSRRCDGSCNGKIALEKELGCLKFELGLAKVNLAKIQEREKFASSKAKELSDEMHLVRNELKFATDAEEKSQKALVDLALALKEVAAAASEAKEKLSASQLELEQVKDEARQLKQMVRNTETTYQKLLDEAKKETDLYRETIDRLKLKFDESLLAEKETGFINCIKKNEEEKALAQHEAAGLAESLKAAEHMTRVAKREVYKLRSILKKAINEANAAKAAADLARDENIQLKDSIAEKEESIHFLTQESEQLKIDEVVAQENIKKLKWLLSLSSLKTVDKEQEGKQYEDPQGKKTSNLNQSELKLQHEQEDLKRKIQDEDPEKVEALKDSTFNNESPKLEEKPHTPKQVSHHRTTSSSSSSDDGGTLKTEDSGSDRSLIRRKKTLFQRVGDLIKRRSSHKREPSTK